MWPAFRELLLAAEAEVPTKAAAFEEEVQKVEAHLGTQVGPCRRRARGGGGASRGRGWPGWRPTCMQTAHETHQHTQNSPQGPLLGGEVMCAADAAVAPKLYHALVCLPHWGRWSLPADRFPAVTRYMAALKQLPAWQKVDYGEEAIIKGWAPKVAEAHAAAK